MVRALDVRTNVDEFLKTVDQNRLDQVPQAMAWAINAAVDDAKEGMVEHMRQAFDRPTEFTLRGVWRTYANKRFLVATLELKDWGALTKGGYEAAGDIKPGDVNKGTPAAAYLQPQIEGGGRHAKRMEALLRGAGLLPPGWFAVPAREAPLDAYGNVPRAFIVRMISDLRAFRDGGYGSNRKAGRRKGRKAVNAFFAVHPNGPKQTKHLRPGIYWRLPGKMLVCVFVFVAKVQYQRRLDFYGVAERLAVAAFPKHWPTMWAKALATDRRNDTGRLIKLAA